MNIIFSIQGGLGKSVVGTAVCKAIRKKYPNDKLIVLTGYPEVFTNNKEVDMAFGLGQEAYFYTKYIDGQVVKIFANDPYQITEHILCEEHLIETWCKMYGLDYNGEYPSVELNEREKIFFYNKYPTEKPIFILQTHGGAPQQESRYSWARDIPRNVIQSVIEEFKKDYQIFHIKREDQFGFENTTALTESFKGVACMINRSEKRLLMDSFGQHTAAALKKHSSVLWICNKPNVFGYQIHDNIVANNETSKPDLRHSVFSKYNIVGALQEFPYNSEMDIFDVDKVIQSIKAQ
jgi:hypothetical protein